MSVVWSMTSLQSGQFNQSERSSELRDLADDFNELRSRGQGYLEVRLSGSEFPQLTLGFRGDHAVVHLFANEESTSLLIGDGAVPSEATVEVPIMDDLTEFTGDFVLGIDQAWDVVRRFSQEGEIEVGEVWCEL
ncbi:hypothetical protein ACWD5W_00110 [Streptomyces sp. NPDC002455]